MNIDGPAGRSREVSGPAAGPRSGDLDAGAGPSAAELAAVLGLVRADGPALVNVGHGRDAHSASCARAFAEAWEAEGGLVGAMVSWPRTAASWLRPTRQLVCGPPDVWVIADEAAGWPDVGRRLSTTLLWRASRTVAFAGLADPLLPLRAGRDATEGIRGAYRDGRIWVFDDGELAGRPRPPRS